MGGGVNADRYGMGGADAAGQAERRLPRDGGVYWYRFDIQYDGSAFHGWARQPGVPTVQGALEAALRTVLGEAPVLRVAGRTDSGVHARQQVVSMELDRRLDCAGLARSLNALTPPQICIHGCAVAPTRFDARADARSRTYRYFLNTAPYPDPFSRGYCLHVPGAPDTDLLHSTAGLTTGRHDFRAFTPAETEHVFFHRTVLTCSWTCEEPFLWLEIEADAFLRQMVRTVVGTMLEVARGKMGIAEYRALLEGGDRAQAGPTAPAHGLFLWSVKYGPPVPSFCLDTPAGLDYHAHLRLKEVL